MPAEDGEHPEGPLSFFSLPDRESHDEPTATIRNPHLKGVLGNIEIISVIGTGGFGTVYRARDLKLGREVAVKFLNQKFDERYLRLFQREAQVIAALGKHPSIVQIFEYGEVGGHPYFVLEYVPGNASRLLGQNPGGLPVEEALRIAAECAEALQFAHANHVLHRDVKPGNILVEQINGAVKLADFGLARITTADDQTQMGIISGSPPYMSPEQAQGLELDERSDVFSLGVTMYELLCGRRPFEGKTTQEILNKVRTGDAVPLVQRRGDLPLEVYDIVACTIAHEPRDRYASAEELAMHLRRLLKSLNSDETVRLPRRSRLVWPPALSLARGGWIALPLVAVIVLLAAMLVRAGLATEPPEAAPAAPAAENPAPAKATPSEPHKPTWLVANEPPSGSDAERRKLEAEARLLDQKAQQVKRESLQTQIASIAALKRNAAAGQKEPAWSSKPLGFFVLSDTAPEAPADEKAAEIISLLGAALEDASTAAGRSMHELNRALLPDVLAEMELAAVNPNPGALPALTTSQLILNAVPTPSGGLKITLTSASSRIITARIFNPSDYPSAAEAAEAIANDLARTVNTHYPLQGRLHQQDGLARIDIGNETGLVPGTAFEVFETAVAQVPLATATVAEVLPEGGAILDLESLTVEQLPDAPAGAWYVRERAEAATGYE